MTGRAMTGDLAVEIVEAFAEDAIAKVRRVLSQIEHELERPDSAAYDMLEKRVRYGGAEHDYAMFETDPGPIWFSHEIREELVDAIVYAAVREYHATRRRSIDAA